MSLNIDLGHFPIISTMISLSTIINHEPALVVINLVINLVIVHHLLTIGNHW